MSTEALTNSTIKPISSNSRFAVRPLTRIRQIIQTQRECDPLVDMSPEMLRDIGLSQEAAIKESLRGYLDLPTGRFK